MRRMLPFFSCLFCAGVEFYSKFDKASFLILFPTSRPRVSPIYSYQFDKNSMPNFPGKKSIPAVLFTKFCLLRFHTITEYTFQLGHYNFKKHLFCPHCTQTASESLKCFTTRSLDTLVPTEGVDHNLEQASLSPCCIQEAAQQEQLERECLQD